MVKYLLVLFLLSIPGMLQPKLVNNSKYQKLFKDPCYQTSVPASKALEMFLIELGKGFITFPYYFSKVLFSKPEPVEEWRRPIPFVTYEPRVPCGFFDQMHDYLVKMQSDWLKFKKLFCHTHRAKPQSILKTTCSKQYGCSQKRVYFQDDIQKGYGLLVEKKSIG